MEQITAKISLTKAEWSLLHFVFTHSTFCLPTCLSEVRRKIETEIEDGLCTALFEKEMRQKTLKKEEN